MSTDESRRLTVSVITCAVDGRVLAVSAPRLVDPEEVEVRDQPVGEAFAMTRCPSHLAALLWNTRFVDLPDEASSQQAHP